MAEYLIQDTTLTDIADAIREKRSISNSVLTSNFANNIRSITVPKEKDINFYDYDGTRLYSYYLSDLPLSELPQAPDHSLDDIPLTFQGWNYTLDEINEYATVMDVGATYVTADGATKLCISVPYDNFKVTLSFCGTTYWTSEDDCVIDWGDDTSVEGVDADDTGAIEISHTYVASGDYVISIEVKDLNGITLGRANTNIFAMDNSSGYSSRSLLRRLYVGNNVKKINSFAFNHCEALRSVSISSGVNEIGDAAFRYAYSLLAMVVPNTVIEIGEYAFEKAFSMKTISIPTKTERVGDYALSYCYSLKRVFMPKFAPTYDITSYVFQYNTSLERVEIKEKFDGAIDRIGSKLFYQASLLSEVLLPNSIIIIGADAFSGCYSLRVITIPEMVSTIEQYAFANCYSLQEMHVKPTTPPTLSSTNVFQNLPSTCKIYVPSSALSAYKSASIWANYSSQMVGE